MKEMDSPGCYERILNELLTANGLPSFNMGGVLPPKITNLDFAPGVSPLGDSNGVDLSTVVADATNSRAEGSPTATSSVSANGGDHSVQNSASIHRDIDSILRNSNEVRVSCNIEHDLFIYF